MAQRGSPRNEQASHGFSGVLTLTAPKSPALSVVGFVLMLVASVVAVTSWRHVGEATSSRPSARSPQSDKAFMDKMEERWRRRQDEGQ